MVGAWRDFYFLPVFVFIVVFINVEVIFCVFAILSFPDHFVESTSEPNIHSLINTPEHLLRARLYDKIC